jgi:RNA polymerase sigma factor (sigma-70 family)
VSDSTGFVIQSSLAGMSPAISTYKSAFQTGHEFREKPETLGRPERQINPMSLNPPSTELLARYRAGDDRAADELFGRYLSRLTALARARLAPRIAQRVDADDVVLSAYRSFFLRARDGRLSLTRSGDLWRLLVAITLHKIGRAVIHHQADRRSVYREQSLNVELDSHMLRTRDTRPDPQETAALAEIMESLLAQLAPLPRRVLEMRLQDYSIEEIAAATGRSERTVRRLLRGVQTRLHRLMPPEDAGK